jgi:hypothetical protein
MRVKIILAIAAIVIFAAGYFGIFEKKKDGYDNYGYEGDPTYDNTWTASEYKSDDSYDTKDKYNDPHFPTGSWDYTDGGVSHTN